MNKQELGKAISDLQGMLEGYKENSDHSRLLFTILFNIEHDMLKDYYHLSEDDLETEHKRDGDSEWEVPGLNKTDKKTLLH